MDAAILRVYEARWRPEERHEPTWLDHQAEKIDRALSFAERECARFPGRLHIGHVALACALGYLDLRFDGHWRAAHHRLTAWLGHFEIRVPAFAETRFVP